MWQLDFSIQYWTDLIYGINLVQKKNTARTTYSALLYPVNDFICIKYYKSLSLDCQCKTVLGRRKVGFTW